MCTVNIQYNTDDTVTTHHDNDNDLADEYDYTSATSYDVVLCYAIVCVSIQSYYNQ